MNISPVTIVIIAMIMLIIWLLMPVKYRINPLWIAPILASLMLFFDVDAAIGIAIGAMTVSLPFYMLRRRQR